MCRGIEDQNTTLQQQGFCSSEEHVSSHVNSSGFVSCELCGLRASLYCQADDAFLCLKCDKWVHQANFLALRHVRCFLCNSCQNLTQRYLIGVSVEVKLPTILRLMETCTRFSSDFKVDDRNLNLNLNLSRKTPQRTFQFL